MSVGPGVWPPLDDESAADPGSDSDVKYRCKPAAMTQARLSERGRAHVRFDGYRPVDTERLAHIVCMPSEGKMTVDAAPAANQFGEADAHLRYRKSALTTCENGLTRRQRELLEGMTCAMFCLR